MNVNLNLLLLFGGDHLLSHSLFCVLMFPLKAIEQTDRLCVITQAAMK